MKEKVYSFDIFDTLIMRKTIEPCGIFLFVQEKLQNIDMPEFLKNNFTLIRREAEYYTQKNTLELTGRFDCKLDDIYKTIQKNYLLSDELTEKIKHLEIQEEIDSAFPVIQNIKRVKSLSAGGKKVILISDMYLNSDIIRKILVNIDKFFENIEIYVSSDTGKRKSNGSLYRLIQEKYDIIEHTGDNRFSDIIQAEWNKIKSINFKPEKLMPYEKKLLEKNKDSVFIQKSAGISRILRQNNGREKIFNFAVSFAAPVIYSYADWILKEALRRDIKTLYFISRDGYVPKIISDIIIKNRQYGIKTRYFYSSRRASRIADEKNIDIFINQIFSELKNFQTNEFIAQRLGISEDELKNAGGMNKEKLLSNNEFKNLVIERNKKKRELFLKYINQEINFNEKFGFVDLNGLGRTQDNLAQLINKEITSFYFNLQTDMHFSENSIKSAYINSINLNSLILELLCRTLDGQTLEYKEENGLIKPVLEYEKNMLMEKWGFDEYIEGIKAYTEMISRETCSNNGELCLVYLNYAKGLIDKETARVLGSIPFAAYGKEKDAGENSPAYNIFNLFQKSLFPNISASRANIFIKCISVFINRITDKKTYGYISKKRSLAYLKFFGLKFDIRKFLWKQN